MDKATVIALAVAAAVLGVVAFVMFNRRDAGNAGIPRVPYYTPGAPNSGFGPPLPASNKISEFLQQATQTLTNASNASDAAQELWGKAKSWLPQSPGLDGVSSQDIDDLLVV